MEVCSQPEYDLMQQFSNTLEIEVEALKSLEHTLYKTRATRN